ncbi:mycofactocin-coupled SDR family oxidoreductase [Nocardia miyunensis]|uniref:mycofactocin-coupled SDR family oxidoreductase n=1 Tax=Nocardia miyunensis TaxID=282684 RepID=UPI000830C0C3|nr:mycofactocin-coupled SDR family oxidoreductase [Nocardia miyunensis]
MGGRVQGKVALITGAARGQGRAHAIRLAEEGASIIALDVCTPIPQVQYASATTADLDETVRLVEAAGGKISAAVVDIRDRAGLPAAVDAAVAEHGGLDIVVANAGICIIAPWDQVTPEIFDETISVNLTGTWNTIMATAPHLVERGGGSMILTSSAAGLKGLPFLLPYVASKHAITGMTKALAHELAQHRIRVNSLHPGGVDTAMGDPAGTAPFGPALEANPGVGGMLTTSFPDPLSQPADQANAVLFLASDESKFVTALALTVDAGNVTY